MTEPLTDAELAELERHCRTAWETHALDFALAMQRKVPHLLAEVRSQEESLEMAAEAIRALKGED